MTVIQNIKWGVLWGISLAVPLAAWVCLVGVLKHSSYNPYLHLNTGTMVCMYFASGIVGGAIVGLVRPLAKRAAIGAMFAGMLAILPALAMVDFTTYDGPAGTWLPMRWKYIIVGCIVAGPALGYVAWRQFQSGSKTEGER